MDIQRKILKLLLTSPENLIEGMDLLHAWDFTGPAKSMFERIESMFLSGKKISQNIIIKHLPKYKNYILSLENETVDPTELKGLIEILEEEKIKRDCLNLSKEIINKINNPVKEIVEIILDKSMSLMDSSQEEAILVGKILKNVLDVSDIKEKFYLGYPTGIKGLDKLTLGLENGTLTIIAGRPSSGKSELCRQIAIYNALLEKPTVVFSIEESSFMYINKIISHITNIALSKVRKQSFSSTEVKILEKNYNVIKNLPIYIVDSVVTLPNIYAKIKKIKYSLNKSPLIIIDYIQLLAQEETNEAISKISRGLKLISRQLDVPIMAVSQLSRAIEQRDSDVPRLSDLRGSGSIEQDGDKIIFITSPESEREKPVSKTKLWILKQREGPIGTVKLKNNKVIQTFEEVSDSLEEGTLI